MENEMRIQELADILTQWDVVEGCKKRMIKLLIGAYNNPLHLAESSLDKPSYRDFPVKESKSYIKLIKVILGVISVFMLLVALYVRRAGYFVAIGVPIGLLRWITWAFKGSDVTYKEKSELAEAYNWEVDADYSKYISRTFASMLEIHKEKTACGACALSIDEMHEFDSILEDNLKENDTLDAMLNDARIQLNYRKREYLAYVYNLLVCGEASSWDEAFRMLGEILKLNPHLA